MNVDPYRHPRLRRRLLLVLVAEDRIHVALRSLRRIEAWDVALVMFALVAIVVHSWVAFTLLCALIVLKIAMWFSERRRFALSEISDQWSATSSLRLALTRSDSHGLSIAGVLRISVGSGLDGSETSSTCVPVTSEPRP